MAIIGFILSSLVIGAVILGFNIFRVCILRHNTKNPDLIIIREYYDMKKAQKKQVRGY